MAVIRVLHVIGAMDRGGAETMIMNLYRVMDRSKVQFDFLVHADGECDYDAEIRSLGGHIYRVPRFTGVNSASYRRKVREHFREHPEHVIVHGHIGSSAAIYLAEAKKAGRYAIAHSHAQNYDTGLLDLAFRVLSRPTREIADYLFACSPEAGIDRFGRKAVAGDHFTVLKNGIDLSRYAFDAGKRAGVRRELGIGGDTFVLGHVGRLTEVKNHVFLFDVFERVKEGMPDAVLLLAGRGELEEQLKADVVSRGLADSVMFLGVRDDVPELLMAMDAFAFPSRLEGLPVALVEAQATGLPCFVSTGVPDIAVISEKSKHLPLDAGADAWAAEILAARADTGGESRLEGIEAVRQAGFDIEQTAAWLQAFYEGHARL